MLTSFTTMERIIESVRKYPCLWRVDSEEYKLIDLKEAAWRAVTRECELNDVKEARACWKKLRDSHRQAIAKKKTVTGQAATSKPTWKYEKQMEFLLPAMRNRSRSTNVVSEDTFQDEEFNNENEPPNEQTVHEQSSDSVADEPYGNLILPRKKATLISVLEKEQRRREQRSIERDNLRKQILLSSPAAASAATKPESAIEKFFNSMLLTTQSLPERLQLRVQRQVFNIVMQAKEDYLATQPINSTRSASEVYTFRGDSPFQLPIAGSSRSASSSSNLEYPNLSQDSPQTSYIITSPNQYTSPPHSSSQTNQANFIITSPNQYTSPPHSSSQTNQANFIMTSPNQYTSPTYSSPQTNQASFTMTSPNSSIPEPIENQDGTQSPNTASRDIRSYLADCNFD